MLNLIRPALVSFAALTFVTGIVYPAIVTVVANVIFSDQANGTVVNQEGRAVGSALIAQPFTLDKYFWPRPSAANYAADAGSGSNLGPTNPALAQAVGARVHAVRHSDGSPVPTDLVTSSGSGLDPHISPAAAEHQIARVARARGISETDLRRLVVEHVEERTFGILGEPRVNVLLLNIALDHPASAMTKPAIAATTAQGWRSHGFALDVR